MKKNMRKRRQVDRCTRASAPPAGKKISFLGMEKAPDPAFLEKSASDGPPPARYVDAGRVYERARALQVNGGGSFCGRVGTGGGGALYLGAAAAVAASRRPGREEARGGVSEGRAASQSWGLGEAAAAGAGGRGGGGGGEKLREFLVVKNAGGTEEVEGDKAAPTLPCGMQE